ncbi:hypothetical protein Y032_0678g1451 [Ancylostoma ceylanicum]|uniref:Uncharacterized protein n=1 Tax=Ancylostoma ceylanicum TaxID=53326 RepID=A0A016WH07_9BILA|nr:hypothetical protein Y032_0678g1451 [Ancylostoma ceylanicum]
MPLLRLGSVSALCLSDAVDDLLLLYLSDIAIKWSFCHFEKKDSYELTFQESFDVIFENIPRTVGVNGGDPSAASEGTQRDRAA